jgi:hypothetical protein
MLFKRAIPPGPAVAPEDLYTGLDLSARAGEDRPYVVCNFVSSADGKATVDGRTAALGGAGDRAAFHLKARANPARAHGHLMTRRDPTLTLRRPSSTQPQPVLLPQLEHV